MQSDLLNLLHGAIPGFLSVVGAQGWFLCSLMTLSLLLYLALVRYWADENCGMPKTKKGFGYFFQSDNFFLAVTFCTICIFKLPLLTMGELNMDESLWIAGAKTLAEDPRPWIAVDGTTSGPLIYAPLVLMKIISGDIGYTSSKLMAIVLWFVIILLSFNIFSCMTSKSISRLLVMPLVMVVSLMSTVTKSRVAPNFGYYQSEILPVLLITLAVYLLVKNEQKHTLNKAFWAGFTLGVLPFSKIQAVPIGAVIACFVLFAWWMDNRHHSLVGFVIGGLLPAVLVALYLLFSSSGYDFWQSYIVNNFAYTTKDMRGVSQSSFMSQILHFPYFISEQKVPSSFFYSQGVMLFASLMVLAFKGQGFLWKHKQKILFFSLILLASIFSVVKPGKEFEHYLMLLFVPLTLLTGYLAGLILKATSNKKNPIYAILFLFISTVSIFVARGHNAYAHYGKINYNAELSHVAKIINQAKSDTDRMAVWGMSPRYYVETSLLQSTREAISYHQLLESPQQRYYLQRYVADLKISEPKFFLDTVSPAHWFFKDRNIYGYENYPEVKKIIDDNYRLIDDVDGVRIFIRRE